MPIGIFALINPHTAQLFITRQQRIPVLHFGVQMLQPLCLSAPFGELLMHLRPQPTRHFTQHLIDALAFKFGGGCRLDKDQVPHVAGIVVGNNVFLFDGHQIRQ